MKMSKSIHDYKEAMDNIKISESFYKRTEALLTELPEVKIEKRPVLNSRRISAVIMSAAACVICLFGVKLALDGSRSDIVTETVSDTDGGVQTETEEDKEKEADELIDDLTGYDDGGIAAESITPDTVNTDSAEPIAANPASDPATEAPAETKPTAPTAETKTTAQSTAATTQSAATEKRVVEGIDPYGVTAGSTANQDGEDVDEDEVAVPIPNQGNPGVYDGNDADIEDDEPAAVEEVPDTDTDEAAPAAGESEPLLFGELSLDKVTVDVTPYFDMENIKSGESTVKKSGAEFKPVLDLMADISKESSVTKINNGSFTSVFSIRIYDANIDLDFYSIYLTNSSTIVITKHSPDGSQARETYALREEHYEAIRHRLFLLFGSESEYELFLNLTSGK